VHHAVGAANGPIGLDRDRMCRFFGLMAALNPVFGDRPGSVGAKTRRWSTRFKRLTDARLHTHNGAIWPVHLSSFFMAPPGADLTGQKERKRSARQEHG
jgi:hypothetical protein